jgi:hypothetical protein
MSRFWASLGAFGVVGGSGIAFFMRRSSAAPPPPSKDDFLFFKEASTNDRISEALKTGDLILFQRGMPERFSARSVFTFLTRGVAQSAWDHVGVVVRDRDPKNSIPYVLEAGPSGVQVPPLCERTPPSIRTAAWRLMITACSLSLAVAVSRL